MTDLDYVDHRLDPGGWAKDLGVSVHACRLLLDADFVDLHNVLDAPMRWFGYRPERHHGVASRPPIGTGHTDFPRLREGSLSGVVSTILPPLAATARGRLRSTLRRLEAMVVAVRAHGELVIAVDGGSYLRAREAGQTAFFLALASGHVVMADPTVLQGPLGQQVHRVGLVHRSRTALGGTARPQGFDDGLTDEGREFVARCAASRVVVDLAGAGARTFDDALTSEHGARFVVSHGGANAVHEHWANLDDARITRIAEQGGVV
ncbi:MAG: membrane dipeptidase, partial [Myxococcota bacterium]